jgi:hypothetical protein
MSEPPPDGLSFDPKTWTANPSTTQLRLAEGVGPKEPDSTAAGETPPAAAPPPAGRKTLLIAGAALLAVVVAGGALLLLHPSSHRPAGAAPPSAPAGPTTERSVLVVAAPADIRGALSSAGVAAADVGPASDAAVKSMTKGAGDITVIMTLAPAADGRRLVVLDARHDDGSGVVVKAAGGRFVASPTAADLRTVVKVVRGEMDAYSFYSSAVAQHLTDSLISPFAQALAFDFDFQREIHQGDVFEAAFEDRENRRGESVGAGRLLYVSMQTKDKSVALYWFQPPGEAEGGWYDANGRSTVRSLMRTPVEGARISSTFGMREHPVLGFMKMHKGIDFAAPVGTPIYAAGDGVLQHAEFKDLDGNYVEILHTNGWQSLYLHLSAFAPGIVVGGHVRQGQEIGQVGTTGRSTGPHLHYEVHVDNEAVDPASLKMESGKTLAGPALAAFIKERNRIDTLRAAQTS